MTDPNDPDRSRVLAPDELDLLELRVGGGTRRLPIADTTGAPVTLTDAENTPLAVLTGDDLRPVKPFARGAGPHWDPAVRRPADAVRAGLTADGGPRDVVAIVLADAPTRAEVDLLPDVVAAATDVLVLVPASRRPPVEGAVGAAGLVRIAATLITDPGASGPRVQIVVVPWPAAVPDGLEWDDVATRYGADRVVVLAEQRDPATRARVGHLATLWSTEVADLYPEASARELTRTDRTARRRGAVVLFTGLSGSGKSTLARALATGLDDDGWHTTLLDGDEVRLHLSRGLGFDKESRELNVDRIGYVAALVSSHGGIAVAAPIAPFASGRARVRAHAEAAGEFLLVHVSTPLEVCEARDRKGLYARARRGEIAEFTGISSPYEEPADADLVIDTSQVGLKDAVARVRAELDRRL